MRTTVRTTVSVAAVEQASGLAQEARRLTEEARGQERTRGMVRGGFGWASGKKGANQAVEADQAEEAGKGAGGMSKE